MAEFIHPGLQTIFSTLAMDQPTQCTENHQPLLAHCFDFPVLVLSSWRNNKTLDFLWAMSKCCNEGLLGGLEPTRAVGTLRTHFVVQMKASAADCGLQLWSSGEDHTVFSSTKCLWMHLANRWVWAGLERKPGILQISWEIVQKKENFLVPEKHILTFPNLLYHVQIYHKTSHFNMYVTQQFMRVSVFNKQEQKDINFDWLVTITVKNHSYTLWLGKVSFNMSVQQSFVFWAP